MNDVSVRTATGSSSSSAAAVSLALMPSRSRGGVHGAAARAWLCAFDFLFNIYFYVVCAFLFFFIPFFSVS